MSQADYDIANQLMGPARTDLNLQLVAGVTNNSGSTEPTTTFAYMWWPDTTTGILKQRNAADTAWINKGTLSVAFVDFTSAKDSKLTGIEASATADQTGAEIKTAYQAEANAFTDAKNTKLTGIEASADVTDTTNVTAAGALMDSEVDADIKTLALPASTTISAFGKTLIDDAAAVNARLTLGLVIGTNVLPEIPLVTQALAEGGTDTVERTWSALRVKQAIAALESDEDWTVSGAIDLTSGSPTSVSLISGASGVETIEIIIVGFSTNTNNVAGLIQLGDSGGLETTGYTGAVNRVNSGGQISEAFSSGFQLNNNDNSDSADIQQIFIKLMHMGSNVWACHLSCGDTGGPNTDLVRGSGVKTLTTTLDRVTILTTTGVPTFDGGTAYVRYR